MVGKVSSGYNYETSNRLGSFEAQYDYAHQVGVDWWPQPEPFHRNRFSETILPELEAWVARPGTIYYNDYDDALLQTLEKQVKAFDSS
jgi:hypothetical protein